MDNNAIGRLIGGCFIAVCGALRDNFGDEVAASATDRLFRYANNPDFPAEDRRIFGCIAHCASQTPEEAAAELAEQPGDPHLRVIHGGSAA